MIDIAQRDMDVPLSSRGEEQATALARWFADQPEGGRPTHVISSPYVRACQTAELVAVHLDIEVDERLREREFGILDRLTRAGIAERYPEQAAARAFLGKFYHRPPGGESWADVALRLRSLLDSMGRQYAGERVLVVSHQVVILVFRYLLERLSEQELLAIDKAEDMANCSLSVFELEGEAMVLRRWNDVSPLVRLDADVTTEPDARVAPR